MRREQERLALVEHRLAGEAQASDRAVAIFKLNRLCLEIEVNPGEFGGRWSVLVFHL